MLSPRPGSYIAKLLHYLVKAHAFLLTTRRYDEEYVRVILRKSPTRGILLFKLTYQSTKR